MKDQIPENILHPYSQVRFLNIFCAPNKNNFMDPEPGFWTILNRYVFCWTARKNYPVEVLVHPIQAPWIRLCGKICT